MDVAGGGTTEEFLESTFSGGTDHFLDGELPLDYLHAACLLLNLTCKLNDGPANAAVEDTAIIWWGDQLNLAIATLDDSEDVDNSHFLNEAVKSPENVVKPVILGVNNGRNQGTEVARDAEAAVTQRPVLENVSGTLQTQGLCLQDSRVDDGEKFGPSRSTDAQNFIR